ncbi:putative cysteine protease YraA [termite gut metagenome]|jgi:4-methyl-5(b-hydroxyethyl)-thiazole monophosphate biosynthesis|uniref:Putative cysteine protease YraA n=1 Tax=termite gut metagenome TaxID=433724 RepID=A0A5J4T149_9ZZZZ
MNTMYVFFVDGFEEIEAIATVDILRRGGLSVKMISVTNDKTVTGSHGIPVICDHLFSETGFADAGMLILPGGTVALGKHEALCKLLVNFSGQNKPIAAICAAPSILGTLGLLKGKKAVCYPGFEKYLEGAELTGEQVVRAGNIITGKGPGATIEFALTIIEMMVGTDKAEELAKALCVKK